MSDNSSAAAARMVAAADNPVRRLAVLTDFRLNHQHPLWLCVRFPLAQRCNGRQLHSGQLTFSAKIEDRTPLLHVFLPSQDGPAGKCPEGTSDATVSARGIPLGASVSKRKWLRSDPALS